jgi:hypothetical protein
MAKLVNLGKTRGARLNRRLSIEVELPEWLIRVIDYRVAEANEGAAEDAVGLNDVVEWCLVAPITLKDVPAYEAAIPGVTAALSKWLESSTYDPSA